MPHPTTLLIAAGVAVAGAATGVHLGRSTVGQINPAYMQDPEVPFYSDLVPGTHPRADWAQVQAQEYQASAEAQPPPAGCVGCTWPAIPEPQQDAAIVRYEQPTFAPAPRERAEAPVRIVIVEQPVAPDRAQVERYSRYQVARDGDPAPVEEDDGEGDAGTQ